jgi:Uma2 family endonuclease
MVQYRPLPTAEDLPETDNRPVDNELQYLVPVLLRTALAFAWPDRADWLMGVNLGIYYEPGLPAIVPDAFLSLGIERYRAKGLRLSYVLWEEQYIVPQWVLEIVSRTSGDEYAGKMLKYAQMGVKYYSIFNPDHYRRDGHDPFEIYRLIQGEYVRQQGNPFWMPELNLALGMEFGMREGHRQNWLYWYDQAGDKYLPPEDIALQEQYRLQQQQLQAEQERQRAEQEHQRAEQEHQRAEQERQRADQERLQAQQEHQRAEQERQRAEQEHQRAEQERQRAEQERQRADQERLQAQQESQLRAELLEKLRSHNIDPDQL